MQEKYNETLIRSRGK